MSTGKLAAITPPTTNKTVGEPEDHPLPALTGQPSGQCREEQHQGSENRQDRVVVAALVVDQRRGEELIGALISGR